MGFSGNLDTILLPDILQLLTSGMKTGTLRFTRGEITKEIYFKDGNIIYAQSSTSEDLLENILLKKGRISQQQLKQCKTVQEMTKKDLASTLVYINIIPKDEIAAIVKAQVEEIIFDLFDWPEGAFDFFENELPSSDYMISALNTMNILMEGTRRIDEWTQIRNKLPDGNTILRISPQAFAKQDEIKLSSEEAQLFSLLDGERSLEEIMEKSFLGDLATSRAIYGLLAAGFIQKAGRKESKKQVIAEKEELVILLTRIFQNALKTVAETYSKKMGRGGDKKFLAIFNEYVKKFPILEYINIDNANQLDFTNFTELVRKLPIESRIHQVSSGLTSLLENELAELKNIFGNRIYDETFEKIFMETKTYLTDYKEFFSKYGVYSDIKRVFDK
ncbi:DUF4388 domain-containing protein [bacterium]|nr:DUF4388 domain-containing protein [bacterium]